MLRLTHAVRDLVRERLAPTPSRAASTPELLVIFALGLVVALARGGSEAFHGVVWAEDGAVFLQAAYHGHGWGSVLTGYQGYAHVVPRLIASVVSYFPLGTQGFMVNLAAAAVQSAVATFAFQVVRSHARGRLAALLLVAGVVAVPVGPETVDNICNLQWFLLFGGCLAPLWQPTTIGGRLASVVMLCAAAASSPFAGAAVGVAAIAWVFIRRRYLLLLLVAGSASLLVQVTIMLTAPSRQIPVTPDWNPFPLAQAYVSRVLGDGMFGLGRYPEGAASSAVWPGLVVAGAVVLMSIRVARAGRLGELFVPALVGMLSIVTFVAPMALGNLDGHIPPAYSGRYSVTPALLFYFAVALLIERVLLGGHPRWDWSTLRDASVAVRLGAAALGVCLVFGLVTSWGTPHILRHGGPSWAAGVTHARAACSTKRSPATVAVPIAPAGWQVVIACSRL